MKIAVLGGGAVGLATALQLRDEFRNADITVFASKFENITSYVAAGLFRVGASFFGPSDEITRKWVCDAYRFYDDLRRSKEGSASGVSNLSGYLFSNTSSKVVENHWMEELVPIYRSATREELKTAGGDWKYGAFMTTLLIQPNTYLPWAREKLRKSGVVLVERNITSLKELVKDYDLIMNCSGLGASELCNDRRMVPIKGQIEKVKAPWIKNFYFGEVDTYIIPGTDGLCSLGGTRDFESANPNVCRFDAMSIRSRCEAMFPTLKRVATVRHVTGLRPHREGGVRVEAERISHGLSTAMVVHDYGHGGYGVCTAPGTAAYAVKLARDAHRSSAKL